MLKEIKYDELKREIERLEDLYLECKTCPPQRNCCFTQKNYTIDFSKNEAEIIFGNVINDYLSKGIIIKNKGRYEMAKMLCPLYSVSKMCSIHNQKVKLGMDTCISFPFKINPEGIISEPRYCNIPLFIVQFRCYAIEMNWEYLLKEFINIEKQFSIKVYVIYNDSDSTWGVLLSDFELLRKAKIIKTQQMYTE